jgi:excisionase family DNA binding protein
VEKLAVSVSEAARLISVSKSTAYALIEQDRLPHVHITEKRIVVPLPELRDWLAKQAVGGRGTQPEEVTSE